MLLSRETEGGLFSTGMRIRMHFVPVLRRYKYTHLFALICCFMIVRSFLEPVRLLLQHHAICGKEFYIFYIASIRILRKGTLAMYKQLGGGGNPSWEMLKHCDCKDPWH